MKQKFSIGFVILLLFLNIQVVHGEELPNHIQYQLNNLLQQGEGLNGAIAGISIRSGESGELLYDHLGEVRLRPASNLKLFTAATSLSILGTDHEFSTEVLTDGDIKWKVLHGNLYLKGKGDPTLSKQDIARLVKNLKEEGIKIIRGDIIADDTWYDDTRYSIDLPWSDETFAYGAQISALTFSPDQFNTGCLLVEATPAKSVGKKATLSIFPKTDSIQLINETETVKENEKKTLETVREHGSNTIIVKGKLPINGSKYKEAVPVWEPTDFVSEMFQQALKEHNIIFLGDVLRGETPKHASLLTSIASKPVSEVLVPFMKWSINSHGEMLVKEMGKVREGEGSWEKGIQVMLKELAKFGVDTESLVIRDGSGISHINLVPANEITKLLFEVQTEAWFPQFFASLPIAGEKEKMVGGTLRHRLKDSTIRGEVYGKTGTLSTVSALSGYAKTKTGEMIIYSILLNNITEKINGKRIEDKIVSILLEG